MCCAWEQKWQRPQVVGDSNNPKVCIGIAHTGYVPAEWSDNFDSLAKPVPYSLLGTDTIVAFNDAELHIDTFENFSNFEGIGEKELLEINHPVYVPSFTSNNEVVLGKVYGIFRHKYTGDIYHIKTMLGKTISPTSGQSLFKWETSFKHPFMRGDKGKIVPYPTCKLKVNDYIAVPKQLPVLEKDKNSVTIETLFKDNFWNLLIKYTDAEWKKYGLDKIFKVWHYNIRKPPNIPDFVLWRECLMLINTHLGKYGAMRYIRKTHQIHYPLYLLLKEKINLPLGKLATRFRHTSENLNYATEITNDVLWLLGFYVAEGDSKHNAFRLSSDCQALDKAEKIFDVLGINVRREPYIKYKGIKGKFGSRSPRLVITSEYFKHLMVYLGFSEKIIPNLIIQLPLSRLKYFVKGMYDGDGNHNSKNTKQFIYTTSNKNIAEKLNYLLLRFGIIAGVREYITKYNTLNYSVTAIVNTMDFMKWDKIKVQTNTRHLENEVALIKIKSIEKEYVQDKWVYDFQVENTENFLAGGGIFAHNTKILMTGQPVDKARNLIVKKFLEYNSPFLFFLDTDVCLGRIEIINGREEVVSDRDALIKMIDCATKNNIDILTGIYYRRSDPPVPGIYKYFPDMKPAPGHKPIMDYPFDRLFEVDAVGAGCLLVSRKVFEVVPRPWFLFGDVDFNEFSEDFAFNHKAEKYGFKTICMPTIQCKHLLLLSVSRSGIRTANM